MTKEELDKRMRELDAREQTLLGRETLARRQKDVTFAEGLVKAGKLLPQHQGFVVDFLEAVSAEKPQQITVEFTEGGKKQVAPREAFIEFLEALGSHPLFKEMTRPAGDKDPNKGAEFAEGLTGCV